MRWLALILAVAGCTQWTPIAPASLQHENAFVIATDETAYDVESASFDGHAIVGHAKHAWQTRPCSLKVTGPDVSTIADCKWQMLELAQPEVRIPQAIVQRVSAERTGTAVKIVAVGLGALGVVAATALVVGLVLLTPNYTCSGC